MYYMITSKLRKSGNSAVLVVPPEILRQMKLKLGETYHFEVFPKGDIRDLFGRGKHLPRKMSTQKIKDMLRDQW